MEKLAGFFGVTILLGALMASGCSYGPRTTVHVEGDLIFDTTIGTREVPVLDDNDVIPNGGGLTVAEVTACCDATPAHVQRRQNGMVLCQGIEAACF